MDWEPVIGQHELDGLVLPRDLRQTCHPNKNNIQTGWGPIVSEVGFELYVIKLVYDTYMILYVYLYRWGYKLIYNCGAPS